MSNKSPEISENDAITETSGGALRLGNLEVRLTENAAERDAAQALRYRVFYDEMGASPTPEMKTRARDFDALDELCEHLLVIDTSRKDLMDRVVGTYRLIRRATAEKFGRFYSEEEYDIGPLKTYPGEVLELGRSCIDANYRTRPTMQLLWRGLAGYVARHDIKILFGCASLPGIDIKSHAEALSYLYYHHLAPPALRAVALPHRYVEMRLLPKEKVDPESGLRLIRPRMFNALPPLIKGYLRVGGYVGDGAVIDEQFNTTDICVIVKTDLIAERYTRHYDLGRDGN